MRWCVGYLDDHELVAFLKKASNALEPTKVKVTRSTGPGAFIFVLDNVLPEGHESEPVKGQRLRTRSALKAIFKKAGLDTHKESEEVSVHDEYHPIVMWALY